MVFLVNNHCKIKDVTYEDIKLDMGQIFEAAKLIVMDEK